MLGQENGKGRGKQIMAQYHYKAQVLKPEVEKAGFTLDQLNLIHRMMRQCSVLRQGKVISSFLEAMLPDQYELREGPLIQGKYGVYRPTYIAIKGQEAPNNVRTEEEE